MHRVGKIMRSFKVFDADAYRQWPIRRCEISLAGSGEHFVASSSDSHNEALFYDLVHSMPTPIQQLAGHSGPVLSVDWHATGLVATASADHTTRISSVMLRNVAEKRGR